jgi:YidC/Oxa1 family membrane protein insertase
MLRNCFSKSKRICTKNINNNIIIFNNSNNNNNNYYYYTYKYNNNKSLLINKRNFMDISAIPTLPNLIQTTLHGIQTMTNMPWFLTFAFSTAFVRIGMLPLVRNQLLSSRKLSGAMPELSFLLQLLKLRLQTIPLRQNSERLKVINIFLKGVNACLIVHGISPMKFLSVPIINISIFVSFVYSLRQMIYGDYRNELLDGGIYWFTDLTIKDPTFILPLTAIGLSYTAVNIAFNNSSQSKVIILIKDMFQSLTICSIPFIANLPMGVFCYWIPSTMLGISQTYLLRNATFQRLLKIPPLPSTSKAIIK